MLDSYSTHMSQFKPNSNIFVKTVSDDMAEMGLITMSRNGMSECLAEEIDYNVYILLSHGAMTLKELSAAVNSIISFKCAAIINHVSTSIQRLNNDKQRICITDGKLHLTND